MDEAVGSPVRAGWWRRGNFWVGMMLLVLAGLVVWDRWELCVAFLFKYFDQDQGLLWYAAREFLHGRFHEPAFYGQDYNTCIESYLAAPLLICGAPYWVALPVVTVVLGLLPFYSMAWWAWRREQWVVAGLALLVPLVLPETYGMVSGMPRGFVPGLALGIVPAVWILSKKPVKGEPKGKWFGWKFFWMGVMGVVAMMLTANVGLLFAPMVIYAVLRFWKRVGFWTGTIAGVGAASLYPLYVHYFYHVWHDDYVVQSRGFVFPVKWDYFKYYIAHWPEAFKDIVPMWVTPVWAATALLWMGIALLVYLVVRRAWVLIGAVIVCAGVMLVSCGWARLLYGSMSVFYPYSRFFLAVPVVMVWAMLTAGPVRKKWKGWVSLVVVGILVGVGVWAVVQRHGELNGEIATALEQNSGGRSPLYAMTVEELQHLSAGVQKAADKTHATMVLFGGEEYRKFDYVLPLTTSCETLFTRFERRTWRMYEENHPRYEKILTLDLRVEAQADGAGYKVGINVSRGGPIVYVIDTNGESVVEMSRKMGLPLRMFDETK